MKPSSVLAALLLSCYTLGLQISGDSGGGRSEESMDEVVEISMTETERLRTENIHNQADSLLQMSNAVGTTDAQTAAIKISQQSLQMPSGDKPDVATEGDNHSGETSFAEAANWSDCPALPTPEGALGLRCNAGTCAILCPGGSRAGGRRRTRGRYTKKLGWYWKETVGKCEPNDSA